MSMLGTDASTETPIKVTSADICAALRRAYAAPANAIFFEVGNATGHRVTNHLDAVAMGIWPSTGQEVHGIEIKISRSDWVRELKNPAKTEAMFRYCDRFFLACPAGLVKPDEVPATWGLLHFSGGSMRVAKKAPKLEPVPLDRGFIAAMVRRAGEIDAGIVASAVQTAVADRKKDEAERIDRAVKSALRSEQAHTVNAAADLEKLKAAAGIPDDQWRFDAEGFGKAVGLVYRTGVFKTWSGVESLLGTLRSTLSQMERAVREAKGEAEPPSQEPGA